MNLLTDLVASNPLRSSRGLFASVAPGVSRLAVVFVNLYSVDLPGGKFVLVDSGVPHSAWFVRQAVQSRYGPDGRPEAVVLTHGHFDHSGNAGELADLWNVPVYAHSLELPYLTGRSNYAPADPTPGGAISFMSRLFPSHGADLGDRVRALPDDGSIPGMPGWKWVPSPGHTPGHVSLFREEDRVLLAGDAVTTTDLDAWSSPFTWPRELCRPPTPLTPDWVSARDSIRRLADLGPRTLSAGHGLPMFGVRLSNDLRQLSRTMPDPVGGRYSLTPAQYAPDGSLAAVPPPAPDPLPKKLAVAAGIAVGAGLLLAKSRRAEQD